ncbi:unnamed protein product [Caretta caretta]
MRGCSSVVGVRLSVRKDLGTLLKRNHHHVIYSVAQTTDERPPGQTAEIPYCRGNDYIPGKCSFVQVRPYVDHLQGDLTA